MKFIAIVSMTAKRSVFQLNDVLHQSFSGLTVLRDADDHVFYQVQLTTELSQSYDFLQALGIERDSITFSQSNIVKANLQYVVLQVADNFNVDDVLENQVEKIYLCYPDNHINEDLNQQTEKNEKAEKEIRNSILALKDDRKKSTRERMNNLEIELAEVLVEKARIEKSWGEYNASPFQGFDVPIKDLALTPEMERSHVMFGKELINHVRRNVQPKFFDKVENKQQACHNDNNAPAPSCGKK